MKYILIGFIFFFEGNLATFTQNAGTSDIFANLSPFFKPQNQKSAEVDTDPFGFDLSQLVYMKSGFDQPEEPQDYNVDFKELRESESKAPPPSPIKSTILQGVFRLCSMIAAALLSPIDSLLNFGEGILKSILPEGVNLFKLFSYGFGRVIRSVLGALKDVPILKVLWQFYEKIGDVYLRAKSIVRSINTRSFDDTINIDDILQENVNFWETVNAE